LRTALADLQCEIRFFVRFWRRIQPVDATPRLYQRREENVAREVPDQDPADRAV